VSTPAIAARCAPPGPTTGARMTTTAATAMTPPARRSPGISCAPVLPLGGERQRASRRLLHHHRAGSLAEVHTCPCGEVLEYCGRLRSAGTWPGMAPAAQRHSWSRPGGGSPDPCSGAHILHPMTPRDRRAGALTQSAALTDALHPGPACHLRPSDLRAADPGQGRGASLPLPPARLFPQPRVAGVGKLPMPGVVGRGR
jgi:hypothetical protein